MRVAGDDGVRRDRGRPGRRSPRPAPRPRWCATWSPPGVDVHEIASVERTLEEVFFEMTTQRTGERVMNDLMNSTRAELLRLRKWPAVWVTIGAWMAMALMFGYLFNYLAYKTGDESFSNEGESSAAASPRPAAGIDAGRARPGPAAVRRRAGDGARRDRGRQRLRLGHLEDDVHPGPFADLERGRVDARAGRHRDRRHGDDAGADECRHAGDRGRRVAAVDWPSWARCSSRPPAGCWCSRCGR